MRASRQGGGGRGGGAAACARRRGIKAAQRHVHSTAAARGGWWTGRSSRVDAGNNMRRAAGRTAVVGAQRQAGSHGGAQRHMHSSSKQQQQQQAPRAGRGHGHVARDWHVNRLAPEIFSGKEPALQFRFSDPTFCRGNASERRPRARRPDPAPANRVRASAAWRRQTPIGDTADPEVARASVRRGRLPF